MKRLRNLPVARKLTLVISLYGMVIAGLLVFSYLGMSTLSGVRAHITGDGFWSRGQKDAAYHLARYAATRDKDHYREYLKLVKLPAEERRPTVETEISFWSLVDLYREIREGRLPHGEFQLIVNLFRYFGRADDIDRLLNIRDEGDAWVAKLERLGGALQAEMSNPTIPGTLDRMVSEIDTINTRLTVLEREHAYLVRRAAGSLQPALERIMLWWAVGCFLISFSVSALIARQLSRGLTSLRAGARRVAKGNFAHRIEIESKDELGDLAAAFNQMTTSLVDSRRKVEENTERLGRALRKLENIMETIPDIICILGSTGKLDLWNRNLEEVTGLAPDVLQWTLVPDLFTLEDRPNIKQAIEQGFKNGQFSVEGRLIGKGERARSYHWTGALLEDALGNVLGLTVSGRDITERKALEEQLAHQAFSDPLTTLPNRALFMDRLTHALARKERTHEDVAVLFLDLDRFKVINDSLGHGVGDQLLVEAGSRLHGCLRPQDTIARLGGDEFAILLEDVTAVEDTLAVAERILEQFQSPFCFGGREVFISASIGIAMGRSEDTKPEDIVRDADLAMYQAKNTGKARYEVFDRGMNARALARMELEIDLRSAVSRHDFKIYYQPIVQLGGNRVTEVEALIRWEHPERGLLPPAEFIHLAEETGLIVPIGAWVLTEACRQAREWQGQFPSDPPLKISVNLSGRQFQQPNLVKEIRQALDETGLEAATLTIEITETVLMQDAPSTMAKLRALKDLGIHIAIDDFGTGYSSLNYLKRFPLDTLKIDRSFVDGIVHDTDDMAIVRAVVTVAKSLNLSVTAEGIETDEQLARLWSLGCDAGQGYYFSRPVPPEAMGLLLSAPLTPSGNVNGRQPRENVAVRRVDGRLPAGLPTPIRMRALAEDSDIAAVLLEGRGSQGPRVDERGAGPAPSP